MSDNAERARIAEAGQRFLPVRGRAAIASLFKFTRGQGHTMEFRTEDFDVLGETAIEIGACLRKDKSHTTLDRGRYMVVWKLVGGQWLTHRDLFARGTP